MVVVSSGQSPWWHFLVCVVGRGPGHGRSTATVVGSRWRSTELQASAGSEAGEPRMFLQTLPHVHFLIAVSSLHGSVTVVSVRLAPACVQRLASYHDSMAPLFWATATLMLSLPRRWYCGWLSSFSLPRCPNCWRLWPRTGLQILCTQLPQGSILLSNQPAGSRWPVPRTWRASSRRLLPGGPPTGQSVPAAWWLKYGWGISADVMTIIMKLAYYTPVFMVMRIYFLMILFCCLENYRI